MVQDYKNRLRDEYVGFGGAPNKVLVRVARVEKLLDYLSQACKHLRFDSCHMLHDHWTLAAHTNSQVVVTLRITPQSFYSVGFALYINCFKETYCAHVCCAANGQQLLLVDHCHNLCPGFGQLSGRSCLGTARYLRHMPRDADNFETLLIPLSDESSGEYRSVNTYNDMNTHREYWH